MASLIREMKRENLALSGLISRFQVPFYFVNTNQSGHTTPA